MKKHLFIAFAAAGLLASCSSNDDDFNAPGGNQTGINENEPAEILIGVGAQASVATRGTGSVGATHKTITANNWAKQIVNVFMFNRGSFELAKDAAGNVIYNDAVFMTPATGSTGVAHHLDAAAGTSFDYETHGYKRSYYPMNGNFSFWAYRVDDANEGRINQQVVTPGSTTYQRSAGDGYNPVKKGGENVYVDEALTDQNDLATETNWKTQAEVVDDAIDAGTYKAVYTDGGDPANYKFTQEPDYRQATNAEGKVVYSAGADASDQTAWKTAADIWAALASGYVQLYVKVTAPVINTTITAANRDLATTVSSTFDGVKEEGNVTVPFVINGTQDVLAASTYLTAADTMALAKNPSLSRDSETGALDIEGTEADSATYANYAGSLYSAKTARQKVQPNLLFKHMLTRFTFNAAAMQPNFAQGGDDEIRIKDIKIYSRTNGKLIAKYAKVDGNVAGQDSVITCVLDTTTENSVNNPYVGLSLQKRATGATESDYLVPLTDGTEGTPFTGIDPNVEGGTSEWTPMGIAIVDKAVADWTALGEALLVMPNDSVYEMDITIEQTVYGREDVHGNGIPGTQEIKKATIKGLKIYANEVLKGAHATSDGENANIQKFLPGHSYNVRVQVYGLSKIEVTTTLEKWVDGGHVDIDPDDQF